MSPGEEEGGEEGNEVKPDQPRLVKRPVNLSLLLVKTNNTEDKNASVGIVTLEGGNKIKSEVFYVGR